jgi:molybdopterin-containing oxidoreductase family iron-sulfur binding subunit
VGGFLAMVALRLGSRGLTPTFGQEIGTALATVPAGRKSKFAKWADAVAEDLMAHKGRSLVIVGERQPPWVHAMGLAVNQALTNVGPDRTVAFVRGQDRSTAGTIVELVSAMRAGRVGTLVILGGNPAYTAPADLSFGKALGKIQTSIHLSGHRDETSRKCTWHAARSHFLEHWKDWRGSDGTVSIQQPLIAPLFKTVSALELLARMAKNPQSDHDLVRSYWRRRVTGVFEKRWQKWLHDGVCDLPKPALSAPAFDFDGLTKALVALKPPGEQKGLEIDFVLDPRVHDGRYANNPWLRETPDTVTKHSWENAALISDKTARRVGVKNGDMVRVSFARGMLDIPVWVGPGPADDAVVIPLGYGRKFRSPLLNGASGFDGYALRTTAAPWFGRGAGLGPVDMLRYKLASVQKHGSMVEPITGAKRPMVREHTVAEFNDPGFKAKWARYDLYPKHKIRSLWREPNVGSGHQWGVAIDLSRCIGCNTCTVACQAENAVSVVGKGEVMRGREMHWIRLDRYFVSDRKSDPTKDPDARLAVQPLPCQQCENAPCETTCPVGATAHSDDGLNDMAYNRCVGTRYCNNNCPFKVRRFNFFNYSRRNERLNSLLAMQRNPDVTVRFRGVMEKCTYCVQRIQEARIKAKMDPNRNGRIREGDVVPACAQACPTRAIAFGDINDGSSKVSQWKRSRRNYALLEHLNVQPRTTYLARLRNPNPKLEPA